MTNVILFKILRCSFLAHSTRCQCAIFLSLWSSFVIGWCYFKEWFLINSGCDLQVGLNLIMGELECTTVSNGYGFYKQGTEAIIYNQRKYLFLHSIRIILNPLRALLNVSSIFKILDKGKSWVSPNTEPTRECLNHGPPKSNLYCILAAFSFPCQNSEFKIF